MYLHSVKLFNYKSIGNYPEAEIIIEPNVTAIIGKNESGKTNVIDGLSQIKFRNKMTQTFNKEKVNRGSYNGEIMYIITLKPTEDEKNIGLTSDTVIEASNNYQITSGGFVEYFNSIMREDIDDLIELLNKNPFNLKNQEWNRFNNYLNCIKKDNEIDVPDIRIALTNFLNWLPLVNQEDRKTLEKQLKYVKEKWDKIENMFPIVFMRRDSKILKTRYSLDEVTKELNNPNSASDSLLYQLVKLLDVRKEDFIEAVGAGQSGLKTSIRNRIKRNLEKNVNNKFADFYSAEFVNISIDFDSNTVYFSVQSSEGESMMLSERSNGLRWYINMFIDSLANELPNSNVVYLFDEPGISLHVNAQRELVNLFSDLCDKGNQVIYTTHSPYMLDVEEEGIHRIRAVVKHSDGNTRIYKTAYDSRISPEFQADTLSPIINALGMNLSDTFGPAKDKLNIITEGMSDYIYIQCMAKSLGIVNNRYNFIPSIGASNCINISNILRGWGCPYIIIFDFDKEGVKNGGEILRNKLMCELGRDYIYINNATQEDVDSNNYLTDSFMVEDLVTREELKKFAENMSIGDNTGKTLIAKLFADFIENGDYMYGDKCKDNFIKLFEVLDICYNNLVDGK